MKLIYLKSELKCDSFDVNIDIKIPFFRVLVAIDPGRSLLQFVTTNCLIDLVTVANQSLTVYLKISLYWSRVRLETFALMSFFGGGRYEEVEIRTVILRALIINDAVCFRLLR